MARAGEIRFDAIDPVAQFQEMKAQGNLTPVADVAGAPSTSRPDAAVQGGDTYQEVQRLFERINHGDPVTKPEITAALAWLQKKAEDTQSDAHFQELKKKAWVMGPIKYPGHQFTEPEIDSAAYSERDDEMTVISTYESIFNVALANLNSR